MGEADQAVSTWQALIVSLENPPAGLYLRLANQQRLLGDVTAAINTLRTLLEHHPATAAAAHELALLLAATNPEAALPYLEQASILDPNLDEQLAELKQVINTARFEEQPAYTLLASGRALGNLDEWNLANLAFQQATELRADYAEAWAYLGYAQERLGKDGGSALQKALGLDPQSLAANLFFAMHFTQTDNPAMALIYLHNAARIKPNMAEIQLEIGNVLVSLGDLPGAQRHYERALSLAGTDANIWRTTAELAILYNIEVRDLALPAARQALLLAPKDAAALDTLGRVYFVLGDPLSARRFFLRALQQDPGYAPAHLHLGMVLILQGDKLAAQDRFRLVLTLVPDTSLAEQAKRLLAGEAP
jgi:tetratricopeptide (TPR) repeat protein